MDGSCLPRFKRALIDQLDNYVDNAAYSSPMDPADMIGADGSGVCAWWDDSAEADIEIAVFTGGPQWYDERPTLTLVIQALGRDTDDSQEVCDQRATAVLGDLVALLQDDPSVATDNADMQIYAGTVTRWTYAGGILGPNLRAASYKVDIEVHARIMLEIP